MTTSLRTPLLIMCLSMICPVIVQAEDQDLEPVLLAAEQDGQLEIRFLIHNPTDRERTVSRPGTHRNSRITLEGGNGGVFNKAGGIVTDPPMKENGRFVVEPDGDTIIPYRISLDFLHTMVYGARLTEANHRGISITDLPDQELYTITWTVDGVESEPLYYLYVEPEPSGGFRPPTPEELEVMRELGIIEEDSGENEDSDEHDHQGDDDP